MGVVGTGSPEVRPWPDLAFLAGVISSCDSVNIAVTVVTQPAFSPQWQSRLKRSIPQTDGAMKETSKASGLFHAALCFTDSVS